MEVYVLLNENTTVSNRYRLCNANDCSVLAEFNAVREVDAYVTDNKFTYVSAPEESLPKDSKPIEDSLLIHPNQYKRYLSKASKENSTK